MMKSIIRNSASNTFLFFIMVEMAAAGNWPTVGGNSMRSGQSDEIGPQAAEILWDGCDESSWFGGQIYIEGDRLVSMRFQGMSYAPVVCQDLHTGETIWSVDFEGTNSRSVPRGFRDGQVYATNFQETGHDTIFALSGVDGSVIWAGEKTVDLGIVWSVVYDSAGNIIIPGASAHLTKLNRTDGHIIWDVARSQPNTGAEGLCVYGNTIYGWTGYLNTAKKITAWDINTGEEKYSSAELPGDGDQEIPPTMGPGGVIYALRDGGNMHALMDNGRGFDELWNTRLAATYPWVQFGVGIDSSLYAPNGAELARLDHRTGDVIDTSPSLIGTPPLTPRITVDAQGTIYLNNGGADNGMLYALTPDLDIIWSETLPYNYYSGPAMGENGALAVAGNGYIVRVYQTETSAESPIPLPESIRLLQNIPNPFNPSTSIGYYLPNSGIVRLEIYNDLGQRIVTLIDKFQEPGEHRALWDGRNNDGAPVSSGAYFYKLQTGTQFQTAKMMLLK